MGIRETNKNIWEYMKNTSKANSSDAEAWEARIGIGLRIGGKRSLIFFSTWSSHASHSFGKISDQHPSDQKEILMECVVGSFPLCKIQSEKNPASGWIWHWDYSVVFRKKVCNRCYSAMLEKYLKWRGLMLNFSLSFWFCWNVLAQWLHFAGSELNPLWVTLLSHPFVSADFVLDQL